MAALLESLLETTWATEGTGIVAAGVTAALAEPEVEATATAILAELEAAEAEEAADETATEAETDEEALALTAAPLRSLPVPQGMASPLGWVFSVSATSLPSAPAIPKRVVQAETPSEP